MISVSSYKKTTFFKKVISSLILVPFVISMVSPASAQILPAPGTMVGLTAGFQPPVLLGLKIHPENPLLFDFIIDQGESKLSQEDIKAETEKLVKYFLAALTIPDKEVWVNLSPYEQDRIIPDVLGQTTMGKTMLEQDYLLKQLASSLTNPEEKLGQEYWAKVKKAIGQSDIPMETFNKVWIVPQKAEVLESQGIVLVGEKRLKVMMADDYVALSKSTPLRGGKADVAASAPIARSPQGDEAISSKQIATAAPSGPSRDGINNSSFTKEIASQKTLAMASEVFRSTILPNIEKEINEGKNFADVRQIYNSVILAAWYKQALKESLLGRVYADKGKVAGVENDDKDMKQRIYEQYLSAFKKGVYNLIKEEAGATSGDIIPRKYFSGGLNLTDSTLLRKTVSTAVISQNLSASSGIMVATVQGVENGGEEQRTVQSKVSSSVTLPGKQRTRIIPSGDLLNSLFTGPLTIRTATSYYSVEVEGNLVLLRRGIAENSILFKKMPFSIESQDADISTEEFKAIVIKASGQNNYQILFRNRESTAIEVFWNLPDRGLSNAERRAIENVAAEVVKPITTVDIELEPQPEFQIESKFIGGQREGGMLSRKFAGDLSLNIARIPFKIWMQGEKILFQMQAVNQFPASEVFESQLGDEITVGRVPGNIYYFPDLPPLSARHFAFKIIKADTGYEFTITDFNSLHGTRVEWTNPVSSSAVQNVNSTQVGGVKDIVSRLRSKMRDLLRGKSLVEVQFTSDVLDRLQKMKDANKGAPFADDINADTLQKVMDFIDVYYGDVRYRQSPVLFFSNGWQETLAMRAEDFPIKMDDSFAQVTAKNIALSNRLDAAVVMLRDLLNFEMWTLPGQTVSGGQEVSKSVIMGFKVNGEWARYSDLKPELAKLGVTISSSAVLSRVADFFLTQYVLVKREFFPVNVKLSTTQNTKLSDLQSKYRKDFDVNSFYLSQENLNSLFIYFDAVFGSQTGNQQTLVSFNLHEFSENKSSVYMAMAIKLANDSTIGEGQRNSAEYRNLLRNQYRRILEVINAQVILLTELLGFSVDEANSIQLVLDQGETAPEVVFGFKKADGQWATYAELKAALKERGISVSSSAVNSDGKTMADVILENSALLEGSQSAKLHLLWLVQTDPLTQSQKQSDGKYKDIAISAEKKFSEMADEQLGQEFSRFVGRSLPFYQPAFEKNKNNGMEGFLNVLSLKDTNYGMTKLTSFLDDFVGNFRNVRPSALAVANESTLALYIEAKAWMREVLSRSGVTVENNATFEEFISNLRQNSARSANQSAPESYWQYEFAINAMLRDVASYPSDFREDILAIFMSSLVEYERVGESRWVEKIALKNGSSAWVLSDNGVHEDLLKDYDRFLEFFTAVGITREQGLNRQVLALSEDFISKINEMKENASSAIDEADNISAPLVAPGGIDFDPTNMNLQIKRDGRGVPLPLPQQNFEQINIQGLSPVIINIMPVNAQTLPMFLGQAPKDPAIDPKVALSTAS